MFKKSKPEARGQAAEATKDVPAAAVESPAGGPPATELAMPGTQTPSGDHAAPAAPAGGEAAAGAPIDLSSVDKDPAAAGATQAGDEGRALELMHIFTEEAEGLNLSASIYEPFLAKLTMEDVAKSAAAVLEELEALRWGNQ